MRSPTSVPTTGNVTAALDARSKYLLDVNDFTCNMTKEAYAFRARMAADGRRARRLVEKFRKEVAAIRLQAASRRLLAVRALQRARDAEQERLGSGDQCGRATRLMARRWFSFALRINRCAGDRAREEQERRRQEEQRARATNRQRAWERARVLRWERREAAAVRLQTAWRAALARRWLHERREDREWKERFCGDVPLSAADLTLSVTDEEPAWLREAESLLAGSMEEAKRREAARAEASPPRSREATRRSTRAGNCSPRELFSSRLPPPPPPSQSPPAAAAPAAGRREGEAWRSGGRQRRVYRDLKAEREAETGGAEAMTEWMVYDESVRSEAERQARLLYREREEARQLAAAMEQSAALGGLDEEGQAIFFSLCDEAGISPADVQTPVRVPRVSDNEAEMRFSRRCRARRISIDGRKTRWKEKLDSISSARTMAEAVMAERFGIEVRHTEYERVVP
jgi:hypothetical protein